jgi:hypothetical protein
MKEERKIHVARRSATEDDLGIRTFQEQVIADNKLAGWSALVQEVKMVEAIVREAFEGYSAA